MRTPDEAMETLKMLQKHAQHFVTDAELHEIFEQDKEWANKQMREDGRAMMSFGVHGRRRDSKNKDWTVELIVMGDWPPADKRGAMIGLGVKYHQDFPDLMPLVVSQVSEAWMSQYDKNDPMYDSPDRPAPSKDPKKIEVVLVNTVSLDQRMDQTMLPIVRQGEDFERLDPPLLEQKHDPAKPADPREQRNYLIMDFFMGYFGGLGRGEK